MNRIDKLPDEYIDASIVTTLLWDKLNDLIEWQNEIVDIMQSKSLAIEESDTPEEVSKVTRLEVIDEEGRVYSRWDVRIYLDYQDGGKTLKIFVEGDNDKRDEVQPNE